MSTAMALNQVLEAANRLSWEEQNTLIDILRRRMLERRQAKLLQDIQAARQEFQAGDCQPATPSEIMKDILS